MYDGEGRELLKTLSDIRTNCRMSDNELQQGKGHERLSKRRRPPLVGYVIAGGLGWILLVGTLAFTAPYFLDVILTARRSFLLLVVGFLLGASTYHLLWGRRIRFGLRGLLAAVFVAAVFCALALYWEYLPGTLHFDGIGLPHGSGTRQYFYDSGALMNEEHYRAGVMTRSTWYKPNGEVIATTIWKRDRANVGYFLYPNGSIRSKMEFRYDPETRLYVEDETRDRIDYAPDGTIEREFRDGKEITKESRGAVESKDTPTRNANDER